MATFRGKAVAVTGGASGIGLATAKLLYEQQALVSIADIDQDALDAVTAYFNNGDPVNCNERIFLKRIDVGNAKEVNEWISETVKRFGRLHGAANVAGVIGKHHGLRNVDELEDDQWDLILRVNLTGMMYSMRAELQHLEDGGSVVCVSSIQGQMGFAKHAAYSASKVRRCVCCSVSFGRENRLWDIPSLYAKSVHGSSALRCFVVSTFL